MESVPEALRGPLGVLMIDNFDSFTWNLYQQLRLLGARVTVVRNDAVPAAALPHLDLTHLVISPGPGHPRTDSGVSRDAITHFAGKIPVLGVCMGLECIVDVFGGEIAFAGEIMHGKLSRVRHDARGCFADVPQGIQSTRYHSLSAAVSSLPEALQVTAVAADSGVIMGVRHRTQTVEAVQYHPESILSEGGDKLLSNFLALAGGTWAENPAAGVRPDAPAFEADAPDHAHATDAAPAGAKDAAKDKVPTILEKIYAQRLRDVAHAKAQPGASPADLDALLAMHLAPPLIPVVARLSETTPALMAEIKRASPSKGDIAPGANAAAQARTYALAGAAVISVLTEPTWFKGALADLRLARAAVDALPHRPALLRKDFVLDEYQIAEARLAGADTVLLIVAMLPPARLRALYAYSTALGMEPLVEVNNAAEMGAALELGAKLVGVNNRNLHDFTVDMGTTSRLADMVTGRGVVLCALSGIGTPADVQQYAAHGVHAVLVGESLMRAPDTAAFIRTLLGWPAPPPPRPRTALVKICGVRSVADAHAAADAGADMLGLMFVPSSKRRVDVGVAAEIALAMRTRRAQSAPQDEDDAAPPNAPWFAQHARALRRALAVGGAPLLVGVFQDAPLQRVRDTVARAQLDAVQLHGSEPAGWAAQLPVPVLRVFHVGAGGAGTAGVTRAGDHQLVLLDAARADGLSGGGGSTLDWAHAARLVQEGESAGTGAGEMPLVLAGGLSAENVAEAVRTVRPFAVDVSGGVERADGQGKDAEKMRAFVQAARGVEL